jgi:hypothetical protein
LKLAPILAAAILLSTSRGIAQVVVEEYEPADGTVRIGPGPDEAIPRTDRGYTLVLPEGDRELLGLVVFFDGYRVSVAPGSPPDDSFEHASLSRGIGIVRLTTGNPLDFLFDETTLLDTISRLEAILATHELNGVPLFLAGLSLGGTRALRVAIFLEQHPEKFAVRATAVAVVDAPLDMTRLWAAERDAVAAEFHPAAAGEGRWVTFMLEANLGGGPAESPDRYVAYSPYTYGAGDGGNAVYLRDVPVRAYHEPDVDWWIENRRKSYYGMNSLDLAGLINRLRLLGNDRAELVTSHGSRTGYEEGASPHTWSIVDDAELVEWFLGTVPLSNRRDGGS